MKEMIQEHLIPPGGYWSSIIKIGKTLKIIDIEGGQGVDFLCYNADNTKERYHAPNTLKAALTLKLKEGDILYSVTIQSSGSFITHLMDIIKRIYDQNFQ